MKNRFKDGLLVGFLALACFIAMGAAYMRYDVLASKRIVVLLDAGENTLQASPHISGAVVASNVAESTATLPDAASGLEFTFSKVYSATLTIEPQSGDKIIALTNATGDRIYNVTAGDLVSLVAIGDATWVATSQLGTWSDGN